MQPIIHIPSKNLLFIQVPKTGSTAIDEAIRSAGHKTSGLAPERDKHYTLSYIKEQCPSINLNTVNIFAVVRNPFSQIVSYYLHWCYHHGSRGDYYITTNKIFKGISSLEECFTYDRVKEWIDIFLKKRRIKNIDQLKFLCVDEEDRVFDGAIIFKYENGLDKVEKYLNTCYDLNIKLKFSNVCSYGKYKISEFYKHNGVAEDVVGELYNDFKVFGYSTDINELKF
jgi:hypothetical protein